MEIIQLTCFPKINCAVRYPQHSGNKSKLSFLVFPSGFIIIGSAFAETTRLLSVFRRLASTDNTGQNVSLFIHLVNNGCESKLTEMVPGCQPDWISRQPSSSNRIHGSSRQNCIMKVRFLRNQCEHRWCHYSIFITLCSQHSLHKKTLRQKTCLLPVRKWNAKLVFTGKHTGNTWLNRMWLKHLIPSYPLSHTIWFTKYL